MSALPARRLRTNLANVEIAREYEKCDMHVLNSDLFRQMMPLSAQIANQKLDFAPDVCADPFQPGSGVRIS